MKTPRVSRLAGAILLITVPTGLAWSLAARRSWLPLMHSLGKGPIKQIKFSDDGQSLTVTAWEKSNALRADALDAGTLRPIQSLARFAVPMLTLRIGLSPPSLPPPRGTPPPISSDTVTMKDPCGFLSNAATFSPDLRVIGDLVRDNLPAPPWQNSIPTYNHVELRDVVTRKLLWKSGLRSLYRALKFSSRGTLLVTIKDGECILQKARDFRRVPLANPHWDYTEMAEFSPDERWLVGSAAGGRFRLWDTYTGQLARAFSRRILSPSYVTEPYTLAFSPDSHLLASADATHTICVWELSTGKLLRALHGLPKVEGALAFAPQASVLAIGDGNTITLWNWRTNTKLRTMTLNAPRQTVTALVWSPDGSVLVSGYDNGTVARWRIR